MNRTKLIFLIITIAILSATSVFADVKIKTRNTVGEQTTESTVYIKGKRQRSEQDFGGLKTVQLTQCDLRRDVQLNTQSKIYFVSLYETDGLSNQTADNSVRNPNSKTQNEKGGIVTTTVTLKDTGERKQMFGYTARHIISTIETVSSPDSCSPVNTKMETDGWYIDADFALECLLNRQYKTDASSQNGGCNDRQIFKQNASGKLGYPVYLKTTMRGENGGEDFTSIMEVTEISPATLDSALFEIPAGYHEVKNRADIFTGGMSETDDDDEDSDEDEKPNQTDLSKLNKNDVRSKMNSDSNVAPNVKTNANSTSEAVGAKQNGVIRIGLAEMKAGSIGEGVNAPELSAAVINSLVETLKRSNIELIPIEGRTPASIEAEAGQKACDYLFFSIISHKKGGGGFGKLFGKIAPAVAEVIPGTERSVEANTAINVGRGALYAAGDAAEKNIKAKDELSLEIDLRSAADASILSKQLKIKAKSDGENIITPLVERIAEAVRQSISKRSI